MMTTHSSSPLYRCWKGLMTLLACGGLFGNLLVASVVGVPLALVSPAAMATCTLSGTTSQTFTYTAANITQAAALPYADKWACANGFTRDNSAHICYQSVFDGSAANGADALTYTVGLNDTANSIPSMTSGQVYGLYDTPVSGGTSLSTTLTVTVPAGQATGMPTGTYSDTNIQFAFDEQGNAGACEGNFVPSTSNWDAIGPTPFTAKFVIPSVCTLVTQAPTINFGNLPGGTAIPAGGVSSTGTIAVQCNRNTPYTVYLGNGANFSNPNRQMKLSAGNFLPYQLYKDSGHSTIWNATGGTAVVGGSGGVNGTGSGSNQNLTVYAFIAAGTAVPSATGTYQDTVVITVTY
jgi:spore coat protein U-like protein